MPLDGTNYDPVINILMGSKLLIERRGWQKCSMQREGGPRCVIDAIREVTLAYATSIQDMELLKWYAGEAYGMAVGAARVEAWQDASERTLEEALAGFDEAVEWRSRSVAALAIAA